MSYFRLGLGSSETRIWLDAKGFGGKFTNWDSDALLGAGKDDILVEVPDLEGKRLWYLMNTARRSVSLASLQGP
jgi:hypothetical protein